MLRHRTCILGHMIRGRMSRPGRRAYGALSGVSAVFLVGAMLAPVSSEGQATEPLSEALGAQFDEKAARIMGHIGSRDQPQLTRLLESEINAFLRFQGAPKLPKGIASPRVHIGADQRVTAEAVIDLGLIREQGTGGWLNPLQYLTGRIPVSATGTVSSGNGFVKLEVEAVTFAGVEVPALVLQELVRHYTRTSTAPEGVRLDRALTLPFEIRELRLSTREAIVVQ